MTLPTTTHERPDGLRLAHVCLDDGPCWLAFVPPERWNGFLRPWFGEAAAMAIADYVNSQKQLFGFGIEREGSRFRVIDLEHGPESDDLLEPRDIDGKPHWQIGNAWLWIFHTDEDDAPDRACHDCAVAIYGGAPRMKGGGEVCDDCWQAVAPRRCHDCAAPITTAHRDCDGQEICGDCYERNMLDTDEAEHRDEDDRVRIAVLDEDGDDPSVTTLAELFESNECFDLDTRATLRKLGVGQAWSEGGGASPWYCVVRLPNPPPR